MKITYNWWPLRHSWIHGITLGDRIYFQHTQANVPDWMLKHELVHVEQIKKLGLVRFYTKYLWYNMTKGYKNNPFEIEARKLSGEEQ